MIAFLAALALGATAHAPSLVGHWLLVPGDSRFGPFPISICKQLDFSPSHDGLALRFGEVLTDGRTRGTALTIVTDGKRRALPAPATLSPVDDSSLPATAILADWKAGTLALEERLPVRADAWRRTVFYARKGMLIEETHVHDIVGDRHARLVYRPFDPAKAGALPLGCAATLPRATTPTRQ